MGLRSVEDQFGERIAGRVRELQTRFGEVEYPDGATALYAAEAQTALEAGASLAALGTTASLLELAVRGLVIMHARRAAKPHIDLQGALEQKKHLDFHRLLEGLVEVELFEKEDAALARNFYKSVRIPVHHGLPARLVSKENPGWLDIRALVGRGDARPLEDVIEDRALDHIEVVIGILERNCVGPGE